MKKLIMTIAIVLSMGAMTFAQDISAETYEERGLFGKGGIFSKLGEDEDPLMIGLPDEHEMNGNQDTPLGSGIAVLMGLGAAYLVGKRRKED